MELHQEKIDWRQLLRELPDGLAAFDLCGLSGSATPFALARIQRHTGLPLIVVTETIKEAEAIYEEMRFFLKGADVPLLVFPPYNILPFKFMAYHNETAARRIRALYQIIENPGPMVIFTTIEAFLQRLLPKSDLVEFGELLASGEEIDLDALVKKLLAGGYNRAMLVEEPGDFVVRGGILDVFSPLYDDPLRIELYGDLVESIRLFAADSQRTLRELNEAIILPARETILPASRLNTFVGRIRTRAAEQGLPVTKTREIVQRIKEQGVFPGIESLTAYLYDQMDTLFDYLPARCRMVLIEPARLGTAALKFTEQAQTGYQSALDQQRLCQEPDTIYLSWHEVRRRLTAKKLINIRMLPVAAARDETEGKSLVCQPAIQDTGDVRLALSAGRDSQAPLQPLANWIQAQLSAGLRTVIICRRPSHLQRLQTLLAPYGIKPAIIESLADMLEDQPRVYLAADMLSAGFVWNDEKLALISDQEIFGTTYRSRPAAKRTDVSEILNLDDLKQGELVVHADHGIGRYEGLVKLRIDGLANDFLLVIYKDDDKLYLPVERMNQVQKYMGVDGFSPVVDKMGGKTWDRVKLKVKRSAEKIAGDLLKLYASRRVRKGHSFSGADSHFQSFEDGFPFEETVDQRKAIDDVLADMQQAMPMDRLVCGDVGYGKTEVALRAAFLAVSEARQVALLVPTTVLAEQHSATFQERFKRFPVNVACLSRFRPAREQRDIVDGLAKGTIDIVIGTHRLLQKDVAFKDLGLLIMDEEQRFGVRHKEKIKRMRETVDVLTLTATPIPRTLHLSLLGIRDISVIATPPEQRRPIVTFVSEYDDAIVTEAITKELDRGGQIFFVHNHVQSIERMAAHVGELVPRARVAVAHGQMPEDQLEQVMLNFMYKEVDLLVCTTIIESGLDVSSANTIIINRADHFGLAQIYQLRGRVGRADEQAYAYLFIPDESILTKDAQKRLKVLMEYSDLGSGFQIAMSDLKIRGGGSILGASQSGHIAAVGYDMFLKLMEESIAELKGEPITEALEPEINLPVSAFLSETYIADIDQRLSFYRRLARMTDIKQISAFKAELEDRYGLLPEEAGNLLLKIMLKVLAVRAGCKRLDLFERQLHLHFSEIHQRRPFGLIDLVTTEKGRFRFTPDQVLIATLSPGSPKALLSQAKNILIQIARHVNQ